MDSSYKVILNPEVSMFTEHLGKLSEADLKFVIFMCDYNDSPFWQLPTEVRMKKAKAKAYDSEPSTADQHTLEAAMDEYRSLIWDDVEEHRMMLTDKINQLTKMLRNETVDSKIKSLLNSIKLLKEEQHTVGKELQQKSDVMVIKGNRKLSNIEQWQRNQKKKREYESIM